MLLAGMLWGAINGTWNEVTQALLDSAKESVSLGLTMLGILSFWCGIMKVVKQFEEKYQKHIPVAIAGGIYTRADVEHAMELGADAVQVATRFVTTEECDAPESYKQAYINAKAEDIVITQSPVGMPGRAIVNPFLEKITAMKERGEKAKITHCYQCLEHCDPANIPYCITKALSNAAEGALNDALLFCGSNAYRADKIETVEAVVQDLVGAV